MLISFAIVALAMAPIDCPPVGTAARDRLKAAGEICKDDPKSTAPAKAKKFVERPLTAAEKAAIIKKADTVLFDGPAARWQWGPKKSDFVYCGMVNGKNRMGAYIGWQPFYYTPSGSFEIVTGPEDGAKIVYDALCSDAGYIEKPEWLKDKAGG